MVKKPKSDNEKTVDYQKKAQSITTILIISLVVVLVFIAYKTYNGDFNEIKTYNGFSRSSGFVYQQNPKFKPELDLLVLLKTSSKSAENPITIDAKLFPNQNILSYVPDPWPHYPEKQYLIMPYALEYPLRTFPEGDYAPVVIELTKSDNPRQYSGTGRIIYESASSYGYFLIGPKEIENHTKNFYQRFTLSELESRVDPATIFEIGSVSDTNTLKSTNIAQAGLIVGSIITPTLKFRNKITDVLDWSLQRTNKRKRKNIIVLLLLVVSTCSITFFLIQNIEPDNDGIYGNKYVSQSLGLQITRPNTDWFFLNDFGINVDRFQSVLPNYPFVGGLKIQRSINERVVLLVFNEGGKNEDIQTIITRDFQYVASHKDTEFIYTLNPDNTEVDFDGGQKNSSFHIKGKAVKYNGKLYLVYGEFNPNFISSETKNLIYSIVDSFKIRNS